jgi:hypothetical protein
VPLDTSSLQQLGEVGSTESGNGIPALCDREALNVATVAGALGNVVERLVALLVQPGVQPSEGRLSRRNQRVVDERKDTSGQRRRGRCTADGALSAVPEVCKVQALRSQIGVRTS